MCQWSRLKVSALELSFARRYERGPLENVFLPRPELLWMYVEGRPRVRNKLVVVRISMTSRAGSTCQCLLVLSRLESMYGGVGPFEQLGLGFRCLLSSEP